MNLYVVEGLSQPTLEQLRQTRVGLERVYLAGTAYEIAEQDRLSPQVRSEVDDGAAWAALEAGDGGNTPVVVAPKGEAMAMMVVQRNLKTRACLCTGSESNRSVFGVFGGEQDLAGSASEKRW